MVSDDNVSWAFLREHYPAIKMEILSVIPRLKESTLNLG